MFLRKCQISLWWSAEVQDASFFNILDMHDFDDVCFVSSSCPIKWKNWMTGANMRFHHPNFYDSWLCIGSTFPCTVPFMSSSAVSVLPTSAIKTYTYTVKAQLSVVTHIITEQSFKAYLIPHEYNIWCYKTWGGGDSWCYRRTFIEGFYSLVHQKKKKTNPEKPLNSNLLKPLLF